MSFQPTGVPILPKVIKCPLLYLPASEQKLREYRHTIFASTASDVEELKLGVTSAEVTLPFDEEMCPVNPFEFFDIRGEGTFTN